MQRRLLGVMLLALGAVTGLSAQPSGFRLFLDHDGREEAIPLTAEGYVLAMRRAQQLHGPFVQYSNVFRTMLRLFDPALQAHLQRAAGTTARGPVDIHLVARDDPYSLRPGETVKIPGGRTHTVVAGDNVLGLAMQYGTTLQAIERENPMRLRVWPIATTTVDLATGAVTGKSTYLGELGMHGDTMAFRDNAWIDETLVHEVAHGGDDSECDVRDYGGDGRHDKQEILTPAIGFFEGWGVYNEAFVSTTTRQHLENGLMELKIESRTAGKYYRIEKRDISPWDLISNERYVARVLWYTRRMLGEAAVRDAFMATQNVPCRFLGDWLKALRDRNPQADATLPAIFMLALAGERSPGGAGYDMLGDLTEWQLLMDGQLAGGITRTDPPRPREYTPSIPMIVIGGDEPADQAAPGGDGGGGLFGF